ncbi:protein ABHD18 [Phlebotomus argentipes]|uniref:protein ABHD18 n=1 Tax=Phlebotomus argentipes TaxID=94469 RepID=UPI0028929F8A|nr:protein ABHD18 [Phlebotomus argentipes]
MPPSRLDGLYRSLLLTKFFCKGWGKPENLQRLFEFRKIISNRESCSQLVPSNYPVEITKDEKTSECRVLEGKFVTPFSLYLPGLVPEESQDAHFQVILPHKWNEERFKPMCIHLAGTGDHYYWKRRTLAAKPLLKEGNIGTIILENPFYGVRKPKDQKRSSLHNVSDIFVMGGCLVLECLVLLNWCERNGYGPLGITGLSMGGHMASVAATNWHKPLVLVPCLSWSTASAVFTQGVMTQSINWDVLQSQYFSDEKYRDSLAKMVTIVDDAFLAGQRFVKHFNESMKELRRDIKETHFHTKKNVFGVNRVNNSLNLSPALLEKLLSRDKGRLTTQEVNELNEKIREAQQRHRLRPIPGAEEVKIEVIRELPKGNDVTDALKILAIANGLAVFEPPSTSSVITSALYGGTTKLMSYIMPSSGDAASAEAGGDGEKAWWQSEALQFMRGVMDECTHLKNFSVPYDTSLIIAVCAKDDAYVPREECTSLEEIWPGAEVRYLDAGHVSAYVLHQKLFRSCIIEAFERAKKLQAPSVDNSNRLTSEEC